MEILQKSVDSALVTCDWCSGVLVAGVLVSVALVTGLLK